MLERIGVAGIFVGLALLTACDGGRYYVGASFGPPAPIVEGAYGVAPGPDYVWTPGYYDWVGGNWAWQRGTWRHRPHPVDRWVEPRYERHGRGYQKVGGGWQHGGHFHR